MPVQRMQKPRNTSKIIKNKLFQFSSDASKLKGYVVSSIILI